MAELIDFFLAELSERITKIQEALDAGDCGELRHLAHQLKGAAGGYGFDPIGQAASDLEHAALSDEADLSLVRERAEELILLCRRAIGA
jgi:HPt (histidine-containing phosphotransfer) domain-containing protein